MKQPTGKLQKTIEELQQLVFEKDAFKFRNVTQSSSDEAVRLLNSIPKHDYAAIPFLLPFVLTPDKKISHTATQVVENMLAVTRPAFLVYLNDRLRSWLFKSNDFLKRWRNLNFSDMQNFLAPENLGIIGLSSFNSSGYVREAALKHLNKFNTGAELPFILIRLIDWVPEIRTLAQTFVEERLASSKLDAFVENLSLLDAISLKKRARISDDSQPSENSAHIIQKIKDVLSSPQNRGVLLNGLSSSNYEVRRMSLRLLKAVKKDATANSLDENSLTIIEKLVKDKDVTNRLFLFDFADALDSDTQLRLMQRLQRDAAPSVRRAALESLCKMKDLETQPYLELGILDKSVLVREFARFQMVRTGKMTDFRSFYINKLQGKPTAKILTQSITGLGETGDEEDTELILSFIEHPQISVRKASLSALGRLIPPGSNSELNVDLTEIFFKALCDKSPNISRVSTAIMASAPEPPESNALWTAFSTTSFNHVRQNCLRLINGLGKWERISYLLSAASLANCDSDNKKQALANVESWCETYGNKWRYSAANAKQAERFCSSFNALKVNNRLPVTPKAQNTLEECFAVCSSSLNN